VVVACFQLYMGEASLIQRQHGPSLPVPPASNQREESHGEAARPECAAVGLPPSAHERRVAAFLSRQAATAQVLTRVCAGRF